MKMKKLILICLTALLTLSSYADSVIPDEVQDVELSDLNSSGDDEKPREKGHKAPVRRGPIMFYLDNCLFIKSPYNIEMAKIIIYDADNNMIYDIVISVAPEVNTLVLPQFVADEKCSIEFIYGNHNYFGYF